MCLSDWCSSLRGNKQKDQRMCSGHMPRETCCPNHFSDDEVPSRAWGWGGTTVNTHDEVEHEDLRKAFDLSLNLASCISTNFEAHSE